MFDADWSNRYKRGEVTDSFGNRFDKTNEQFPQYGLVSALGPVQPREPEPFSCDAHMVPALRQAIAERDPRAMTEYEAYIRRVASQRANPLHGAFDYARRGKNA